MDCEAHAMRWNTDKIERLSLEELRNEFVLSRRETSRTVESGGLGADGAGERGQSEWNEKWSVPSPMCQAPFPTWRGGSLKSFLIRSLPAALSDAPRHSNVS